MRLEFDVLDAAARKYDHDFKVGDHVRFTKSTLAMTSAEWREVAIDFVKRYKDTGVHIREIDDHRIYLEGTKYSWEADEIEPFIEPTTLPDELFTL